MVAYVNSSKVYTLWCFIILSFLNLETSTISSDGVLGADFDIIF